MFPNFFGTAAIILLSAVFSYAAAARNAAWVDEAAMWKDASLKSPLKPRPQLHYGIAFESAGDESAAESRYLLAIRLDPGYVEAYGALAVLYGKRADLNGAESMFKAIISRFPEDYKSHSGLGVTYLLRGAFKEAEREFKASLDIRPDYAPALQNLINLYAITGRGRESDEYRRKLVALTGQ